MRKRASTNRRKVKSLARQAYHGYGKTALRFLRLYLLLADSLCPKSGTFNPLPALLDSDSNDANVQGMRRLLDITAADRRVSATGIQTVGSKGYDGSVLARVMG